MSAIATTANDDRACLGPAALISQKKTFVSRDRIKSIPESATPGPGSINISVRIAASRFVGRARQDRHASAFLSVHLTIPHFPRRPNRSGRNGVTHGRPKSPMSSIGTPNRRHLDASPPRAYCCRCSTGKSFILSPSKDAARRCRSNHRAMPTQIHGEAKLHRQPASLRRAQDEDNPVSHPRWRSPTVPVDRSRADCALEAAAST